MMKNNRLIKMVSGLALAGLVSACGDLDRFPANGIEQSQSFQSLRDAKTHNNGMYAQFRGIASGIYIYTPDIQSDLVNASIDYGNRGGSPHRWTSFLDSDYDLRDTWSGYYSRIANVNNWIAGFEGMSVAANEQAELDAIIGDAYFARAFYYFQLVNRFAKPYNPSTASSDLGVPLVLKFDVSLKPARSSVEEVYAQILSDLDKAKSKITATGAQGATRFTKDVVLALEARIKLNKQDWAGAKAAADAVINAGKYPLITNADDLKTFWHNDGTQEVIFQPKLIKPSELGNTVSGYLGYNAGAARFAPDYIPTQATIDMYDDNDFRKSVYFAQLPVLLGGVNYDNIYLVNKYPGNPELFTGANTNYQHAYKLFRVAELYLISAEASYKLGNNAEALATLNQLRTARGLDALAGVSGDDLFTEIKNERFRELAFEGFRLDDLKRWGMGLQRGAAQNEDVIMKGDDFQLLSKPAGDNKFVWGIPANDITINKNLVQNPGW